MLWVVVWEYKVEEGDSQMEKQVFGTLCKYLEFPCPQPGPHFFLGISGSSLPGPAPLSKLFNS